VLPIPLRDWLVVQEGASRHWHDEDRGSDLPRPSPRVPCLLQFKNLGPQALFKVRQAPVQVGFQRKGQVI